jgi:hypothetical protein
LKSLRSIPLHFREHFTLKFIENYFFCETWIKQQQQQHLKWLWITEHPKLPICHFSMEMGQMQSNQMISSEKLMQPNSQYDGTMDLLQYTSKLASGAEL